MRFDSTCAPSIIAFDGRLCQCSNIVSLNCNSSKKSIILLKSSIRIELNDTSSYLSECTNYPINLAFMPSFANNINLSMFTGTYDSGTLHCSSFPPEYCVKFMNFNKIYSHYIYGQSCSSSNEMLNYKLNFLNCTAESELFFSSEKNHKFESFLIVDCQSNGFIYKNSQTIVTFVDCLCQSDYITSGCLNSQQTDFSNAISGINLRPKKVNCNLYDTDYEIDKNEAIHSITFSIFILIY